jgi:hypothetical protein
MRLRAAERDALQGDAARATREVEDRTRECESISRSVELAEGLLRSLRRSGAQMSVDEEMRLQEYLRHRREQHAAKQRELEDALRARLEVLAQLQAKQQDARALETHRDRQRRRFDDAQARAALASADDQWLRRRKDG